MPAALPAIDAASPAKVKQGNVEYTMNPRDIVIELLSQLGSSREAREYLRKFSSRESSQFAVIKVGGEVLQNDLSELASSIGFLHHVGLFPIVLHGAGAQLNEALQAAGIESRKIEGIRVTSPEVMSVIRPVVYQQNLKLVEALEQLGIRSRSLQHGVFECDYQDQQKFGLVGRVIRVNLDSIRSTIAAGSLPIVTCLGETPGGQVLNVNADAAAARLVLAIQPRKIIFLTPTGGLLDEAGQVISSINLETDYQRLLGADWVHSGMRLKLIQIAELLDQLPLSSSVSITSAGNLTRELFTHRGAGTLIRRGEGFVFEKTIPGLLQSELKTLIEVCFHRQLRDDYFDCIDLDTLIWAGSGRAAAVIERGCDSIAYMDKFAVTPSAQGEGLGTALWEQIRERYSQLYWRSRAENPVNSWYNRHADFCVRRGKWQIFGYGMEDLTQVDRLVRDSASRPEYWQDVERSETTWA
jgi:acetylglutamate kinase